MSEIKGVTWDEAPIDQAPEQDGDNGEKVGDLVSKSSDSLAKPALRFDGPDVTAEDVKRLSGALFAVRHCLSDGQWWTLARLARHADCGESGASARLRDLRKARFGGHTIERRRVTGGLWEYRMEAKRVAD